MKLRYDPFQIFRFSKTPAGLYARQKWLGESEAPQWKTDFQETVEGLWAHQLADGSWQRAPIETISRLFGLHLTVRSSTAQIDAALDWLIEKIHIQSEEIQVDVEESAFGAKLVGLPFVRSRPAMFLAGASLFLATIFDRESDPAVLDLYQWLCAVGMESKGCWFDDSSSHNIFRAMVVHPKFAQDKVTGLAVERLANLQSDSGDWGDELPFFQTLNALAHLDLPHADSQLERGFKQLHEKQNRDGTWSRSEPEWNAFLAIHALKNKKLM
jgi:hypothetical protein